jgi:hypothetical protein
MKIIFSQKILLLLVFTLLFNCQSKEEKSEPTQIATQDVCDDCKFGKDFILKPEHSDLSFKVDISEKTNFQPFQYDLLHSYGILGRIDEVENDTLKKISFGLLDVGDCDRYKIVDAHWEKMKAEDSVNYHHYLFFNIEKITPTEKERIVTFTPNVPIHKNEVVKINITSKSDPRINLPNTSSFGNSFAYVFPPLDCPIKLIDP